MTGPIAGWLGVLVTGLVLSSGPAAQSTVEPLFSTGGDTLGNPIGYPSTAGG